MRVTMRMLGVSAAVACATACGIGGFVAAEATARALPVAAVAAPARSIHAAAPPIAITRDGRVRGRVAAPARGLRPRPAAVLFWISAAT